MCLRPNNMKHVCHKCTAGFVTLCGQVHYWRANSYLFNSMPHTDYLFFSTHFPEPFIETLGYALGIVYLRSRKCASTVTSWSKRPKHFLFTCHAHSTTKIRQNFQPLCVWLDGVTGKCFLTSFPKSFSRGKISIWPHMQIFHVSVPRLSNKLC